MNIIIPTDVKIHLEASVSSLFSRPNYSKYIPSRMILNMNYLLIFCFCSLFNQSHSLLNNFQINLIMNNFSGNNIFELNCFFCSEGDGVKFQQVNSRLDTPFLLYTFTSETIDKTKIHQLMETSQFNKLGVLLDIRCEPIKLLFLKELSAMIEDQVYSWLLLSSSLKDGMDTATKCLKCNGSILVLENSTISHQFFSGSSLIISNPDSEVYWPSSRNKLIGLAIRFIILPDKEKEQWVNMEEVISDKKLLNDNYLKFSLIVHSYLQDIYGFRWVYVKPKVSLLENQNSQYGNACLELNCLITGLADVGFSSQIDLSMPSNDIQITSQLKTYKQSFIMRRPPTFLTDHFLLAPFSNTVWKCILATMFFTIFLLWALRFIHKKHPSDFTIFDSIIAVVGVFSNQGLSTRSIKPPRRIFSLPLLLFTFTLNALYNAAMINILLYPVYLNFQSVSDIRNDDFEVGASNTSYNRYYFGRESRISLSSLDEAALKNQIAEDNGFYNLSFGVENLRLKNFVYLALDTRVYSTASEYLKDPEICSLGAIFAFDPFHISLLIRKGFSYREDFQRGVLLLKETGIAKREDLLLNKPKPSCLGEMQFNKVEIQSIYIAYCAYLCGFALSCFLFCLELLLHKNESFCKILCMKCIKE